MTKVLAIERNALLGAVLLLLCACSWSGAGAQNAPDKPAEGLYRQLSQVGLDPTRVYQVRGASLNRSAIQISLDDGTIGFTQDVMGHITGAFFEGDGEILLSPPDEMERRSMSFFTGMAILEERFATAYFRFNDEAAAELAPDLRATDEKKEFVDRWEATAKNLAGGDAIRLLMTFSRMLPVSGGPASQDAVQAANGADRFLHARLQGVQLGVFDVFFDSTAPEQVQAGQAKEVNGETYYDVWTSFSPKSVIAARPKLDTTPQPQSQRIRGSRISVRRYTINADVTPPKQIHARARLQCEVLDGGERTLLFELSRFLPTESVTLDGRPVEFIHNPSIEGTQLSRRGNDVVAVVLPEPTRTGQQFQLEFVYGGEVLAEAGNGLLYVGARGTWYPNRGMEMTDFDLQFTYPQEWTLVATGKPAEVSPEQRAKANGEQVSRWVSDRPIPLAGFNLGKYREATTRAGNVSIETYATRGVEKEFPNAQIQMIAPPPIDPTIRHPQVIVAPRPSPAQNEIRVGQEAAQAIQYFSDRFGPFPYSHLALTQFPGRASQGWPGLVFLSSYAFLNDAERQQLHYDDRQILMQQLVPAHETAHQWWGDLVSWTSYRDQWFSEGLSQYCTLMMLQEKNPAGFRAVMDEYRRELLKKDEEGKDPEDAGAVTLGTRLVSSRLPGSYEAITYGRGTWLFHMLRSMMKDGERTEDKTRGTDGSEPFVRALRTLRQRYEGKAVSTRELLEVFAEELPLSLRYQKKKSLDWFLEGWVNGNSIPKLETKGVKFSSKQSGRVLITGSILQKDAPQDLVTSVPVYAVAGGKEPVLLGRVFADGDETSFHLSAPAGTRKIVLDPFETVLRSPK